MNLRRVCVCVRLCVFVASLVLKLVRSMATHVHSVVGTNKSYNNQEHQQHYRGDSGHIGNLNIISWRDVENTPSSLSSS